MGPKEDRWIIPRKQFHHVAIYPNNHVDIQDPRNQIPFQNDSVQTMPSFIVWNNNKSNFKDDFDAILKAYAGCIYNFTKIREEDVCTRNRSIYCISEKKLQQKIWEIIRSMNGPSTEEKVNAKASSKSGKPINHYDITLKVPIENE